MEENKRFILLSGIEKWEANIGVLAKKLFFLAHKQDNLGFPLIDLNQEEILESI
jgi:hypothetical protein